MTSDDTPINFAGIYGRKKGLEYTENVFPEGIANRKYTTAELWNAVEVSEKRKNSIVGREYVIALPEELNEESRKKLAVEFAKHISNKYKIVANVALHAPGKNNDARNYHAHIMTSTREITSNGFGEKTRILDCKNTSQKEIADLRNVWAEMGNRYLEAAQSGRRMDARSFAERGLDAIPEVHLGPAVSAMERRGIVTDKGTLNRKIRARNQKMKQINLELKNIEEAIQAAEAESLRRETEERSSTAVPISRIAKGEYPQTTSNETVLCEEFRPS
jgi:ATP-dependent exoDNAse (exonuclease V) alpha subunit